MSLPLQDFEYYQKMLYAESGLAIKQDKTYLLESRLNPLIKKLGIDDLGALTNKLRGGDNILKQQVVEAMTVNETFFFRDIHPFDRFRDIVIPKIIENKPAGSTIRIWCAACSSGQEPYSLAILLKENAAKFGNYRFEIIGTDLSSDILDVARKGKYTQFEVQRGMPIQLLVKYFTQEGTDWHLKDDIKKMVRFENFNLLKPMTKYGTLDVIFCRNVLIYFDPETKAKILAELHARMPKFGFLFLGGAETVVGVTDKFKPYPNERGIYVPHDSIYQ
jgi:chemotaxis protein methyltransferase CheR